MLHTLAGHIITSDGVHALSGPSFQAISEDQHDRCTTILLSSHSEAASDLTRGACSYDQSGPAPASQDAILGYASS